MPFSFIWSNQISFNLIQSNIILSQVVSFELLWSNMFSAKTNPTPSPHIPRLFPFQRAILLSTWNFHCIILKVKQHHPRHKGWQFPPSLQSGTINILQVPPFLTPHSWHPSNKDIIMKLSGYLSWVNHVNSLRMTLSTKSPIRNPSILQISTSLLDSSIPNILLMSISTRNFVGFFLTVKHYPPWFQEWPYPSSL